MDEQVQKLSTQTENINKSINETEADERKIEQSSDNKTNSNFSLFASISQNNDCQHSRFNPLHYLHNSLITSPLFPLVFFDRSPDHCITSLSVDLDSKYLISGSLSGECCFWNINTASLSVSSPKLEGYKAIDWSKYYLSPIALLLRICSTSSIVAIVQISYFGRAITIIGSVDGYITGFCNTTMRSLFTYPVFPPSLKGMQPLANRFLIGWSSHCNYVTLFRFDKPSDIKQYSVSSLIVSAVGLEFKPPPEESFIPVSLFVLTTDCTINELFLQLPIEDVNDPYEESSFNPNTETIHHSLSASFTISSPNSAPLQLLLSNNNLFLLIVLERGFYIASTAQLSQSSAYYLLSNSQSSFIGASFISSSDAIFYILAWGEDYAEVYMIDTGKILANYRPTPQIVASLTPVKSSVFYIYGDRIFCGTKEGEILEWKWESVPSIYQLAQTHIPNINFSKFSERFAPNSNCTVSTMFYDETLMSPILVRGLSNGQMTVSPVCYSTTDSSKFTYHACSYSLTSLLGISSSSSVNYLTTPIIVAASSKGEVCIFQLIDFLPHLAVKFLIHYLEIKLLSWPYPDQYVYSAGEDCLLCVYSLSSMKVVNSFPAHDSPVIDIYRDEWCIKPNIVIAKTTLSSYYIWNMTSGCLERVLRGENASVLSNTYNLSIKNLYTGFSSADKLFSDDSKRIESASLSKERSKTPFNDLLRTPRSGMKDGGKFIKGEYPSIKPSVGSGSSPDFLLHFDPQLKAASLKVKPTSLLSSSHSHSSANIANTEEKERKSPAIFSPTPTGNNAPLSSPLNTITSYFKTLNYSDDPSSLKRFPKDSIYKPIQILSRTLRESLHMNMILLNIERYVEGIRIMLPLLVNGEDSLKDCFRKREMAFLSLLLYLFDWGSDDSIDEVQSLLFGNAPFPPVGFALISDSKERDDETFLLFSPFIMSTPLHWTLSSYLSAFQVHIISSVCLSLLTVIPKSLNHHISTLVTQYGINLPLSIPSFGELSLDALTFLLMQKSEEIYNASRLLIHGVIDRLGESVCANIMSILIKQYLTVLPIEQILVLQGSDRESFSISTTSKEEAFISTRELRAVIIVATIIIKYPSISVSVNAMHRITDVLIHILNNITDCAKVHLAIDLLRKEIPTWRNFILDMRSFILQLWKIYWHCINDTRNEAKLLSSLAVRALIVYGESSPKLFASTIGSYVRSPKLRDSERNSALLLIRHLVKLHHESVYPDLLSIVEIIIHCLDPSEPNLRHRLLESSTKSLKELVERYPMVDFNQSTQRFAVGTNKSQHSLIIVYDLRTATKWRILQGHTGTLTAVAFTENAELLASYSHDETPPTIRIWKTGSSGFFGSFLGMTGHCVKVIPIAVIDPKPADILLYNVKMQFLGRKRVKLVREDGSICTLDVSC